MKKEVSHQTSSTGETEEQMIIRLNAEIEALTTEADQKLTTLNNMRQTYPDEIRRNFEKKKKIEFEKLTECALDLPSHDGVNVEKMKEDISRVVNTKADLDEEREDLENQLRQVEEHAKTLCELGHLLHEVVTNPSTMPFLLKK